MASLWEAAAWVAGPNDSCRAGTGRCNATRTRQLNSTRPRHKRFTHYTCRRDWTWATGLDSYFVFINHKLCRLLCSGLPETKKEKKSDIPFHLIYLGLVQPQAGWQDAATGNAAVIRPLTELVKLGLVSPFPEKTWHAGGHSATTQILA